MPERNLLKGLLKRYSEQGEVCDRIIQFMNGNADCFSRSNLLGHITGSAWLIDESGTHVLLTHHKKLGEWLQLGGHADGDSDILRVALKEAQEESGIFMIEPLSDEIFDVDIHEIPEHKGVPTHNHYDIRFLLRAKTREFVLSDESNALSWVPMKDIIDSPSFDPSLRRMAQKWLGRLGY